MKHMCNLQDQSDISGHMLGAHSMNGMANQWSSPDNKPADRIRVPHQRGSLVPRPNPR